MHHVVSLSTQMRHTRKFLVWRRVALLTTLLFVNPPPVHAKTVPRDRTPPTGTIVINSGATYTTSTTVTLLLFATDNSGTVAQMQCSNDNVTYSPPEPYATTKVWTLTTGDGTKTVYVKFSDPSGNWSVPYRDTIILDAIAPSVTITWPGDGATLGAQ